MALVWLGLLYLAVWPEPAAGRMTRCDARLPVSFTASHSQPYLAMTTMVVNTQIGSRPGILSTATAPSVLIPTGTTIYVPDTGTETSAFNTNTTDLFYAACQRVVYPAVLRVADITTPLIPIEALFAMGPVFTWSMAHQRGVWAENEWRQYFKDRPDDYCIHKKCANPFDCALEGTANGTWSIEVRLTFQRAGIGLSSDLYAAGGCTHLHAGNLRLTACVGANVVCRSGFCRPPVYELTESVTNYTLVGMDPLLPNKDLGLTVHWRSAEGCGVVGQAWDETAHLLPSTMHYVWFVLVFIIFVVVQARPSVDDIILLLGIPFGQPLHVASMNQRRVMGVIRMLPVLGGTVTLAATVHLVVFKAPTLTERAARATIDLAPATISALPYLVVFVSVMMYFGLLVSAWVGYISRTNLQLFYTPLLLLCFQVMFAGGGVNDWSTIISCGVAVIGIAEAGRNVALAILCKLHRLQLYIAVVPWMVYVALLWILGMYPMVGIFDQLDEEHWLATTAATMAASLIYFRPVYNTYVAEKKQGPRNGGH
jgi:hypothetical protein